MSTFSGVVSKSSPMFFLRQPDRAVLHSYLHAIATGR